MWVYPEEWRQKALAKTRLRGSLEVAAHQQSQGSSSHECKQAGFPVWVPSKAESFDLAYGFAFWYWFLHSFHGAHSVLCFLTLPKLIYV